ncbi:MAG: hypothetical protein K9L88_03150, partial [Chromatiaceae bacterium]|nr:hypothetical protein [Chromatiaceae bacterium]
MIRIARRLCALYRDCGVKPRCAHRRVRQTHRGLIEPDDRVNMRHEFCRNLRRRLRREEALSAIGCFILMED